MASANFKSCDFFFLDKGCNLDALAFADCACNSVAAETWWGASPSFLTQCINTCKFQVLTKYSALS